MRFTDLFIRRPVFASVLSLILLTVGILGWSKLNIRQYPKIDTSVITVTTSYPGASSQLMEGFVTTPLENAIAGVDGIDYLTSSSSQGISNITINLKLGYDINKAITDVSDAISSVRYQLPKDVYDPVVAKQDPNANPTLFISFSSKSLSPEGITDYLLRVVQPQIQTLPGVGQAKLMGERKYAMRIWLNPELMAAHHVTTNDVMTVLQNNNIQAPAGHIRATYQNININAVTDIASAQQFNNLIIKNDHGQIVRLKDIGSAKLGAENDDVSVIIDGKPQVVMGIIPKSDANPLDVSREIYKTLPTIRESLPAGMKLKIAWDSSIFIAQSIKEVIGTIFIAALCVIIVIFLFIGSLRSVMIPVITIPLSLIGAMAFMHALGYSINTLTLLAFVLAIGMVVDDAIVVLENIHRHIESGMKPFAASMLGAREIAFPVIAMTLTLAAVYTPIGFMAGFTGSLFKEFAFTLAGTVIISGFIALTLSPMMCSKIMMSHENQSSFVSLIDNVFQRIAEFYQRLLTGALNFRPLIICTALCLFLLGAALFNIFSLHQQIVPPEDQGALMSIIFAPSDSNLAYTQKYTNQLINIYKTIPDVKGYGIINGFPMGVNSALSFLVLKPWNERKISTTQVKQMLIPKMWSIPGVMAMPNDPPDVPGAGGFFPIEFVIKTTGSYEKLNEVTNKFLAAARQNTKLLNLRADLQMDQPQINIHIDRNKANQLGINMTEVANTLNSLLGKPTITRFVRSGRSYDVIPEINESAQLYPEQLNNVNIKTASGELTPLSNIVSITTSATPNSLNHFQQMRSATITAIPFPGYSLGQAITYLTNLAKKIVPPGMTYDYGGQSRQFVQASGTMMMTFIFALIFIFLVLSAQFESFVDPFIVMISVPLSLVGALIAMFVTKCSLNIYTEIGLVTLIGLISKHGILMVEFANQQQKLGLDKLQAIIKAATIRLRPILMTTFAMILGAVPLALATGAGSEARRQMGWVIIGGMSIGTLFTLFVVPVVYSFIARKFNAKAAAEKDEMLNELETNLSHSS